MNKLSKRFLIGGGTAAALAVATAVAMDLYAGSQAVRERAESELSKKLGAPAKIGSLHFNFWSGLVARDVAVTPPVEGGGSSLAIPRVSAAVSWLPLFSHRFEILRLVFTGPVLTLAQDSGGRWNLEAPKPPSAAPETAPAPSPGPSAAPAAPGKPKKPRFDFVIKAARIENGTLRWIDREGKSAAVVEGIAVECPGGVRGDSEGRLSVRKAVFDNGWTFEELKTPFVRKGRSLTLPDLSVRLGGGTVRGKLAVTDLKKDVPFTLDLQAEGVELRQLQIQVQGEQPSCKTVGTLNGTLDIYGLTGRKKSVAGTAHARVHNGRMSQVPLLQTIGKALGIEELTCLELRQAQLDLRAGEGKIYVDSLVMESPNLSLTAAGTSSWGGKLALDARLAASPKVTRQLPRAVETNFQPVPGAGDRKALAFHINGTVEHPQTDLMRVLVGQKIESELINVFRALTGKPKKNASPQASPASQAEENLGH